MYIYNCRKTRKNKHTNIKAPINEDVNHIYDELSMFTIDPSIINKTPSPKSDKVIFDTKKIEPPAYQPLPKPRYENCSLTSIEKSNNSNEYTIEEDVRSINEEDCTTALGKTQKQPEQYCKLYHFK